METQTNNPAPSTSSGTQNTSQTQENNSNTPSAQTQTEQSGQAQTQNQTTTPATNEAAAVFDLKFPEGSGLPKDHTQKVIDFAKENGLTPAQAQKILDRDNAYIADSQKAAKANLDNQIGAWEKQIQEDTVLGGEKFAQNMEVAKRGFEKVATPELKKILNESGYGSHPEVVRLFYKLGLESSEDSFQRGGPAGQQRDRASVFYPNMK
ncbi:hypothetical protein ACES2L_06010 [Bdellovibrio bacteriovorus]